jgi:uncharacterized protein
MGPPRFPHAASPRTREFVLALALFPVLLLGGVLVVVVPLARLPQTGEFFRQPERLAVIGFAVQTAAIFAVSWLAIRRPAAEKLAVLGLRRLSPPWPRDAVLAGVALVVGCELASIVMEATLGYGLQGPGAATMGLLSASPARFAFVFLVIGYFAPLAEEMLFRGLVFAWMAERLGVLPAALLSSALFGLAHLPYNLGHALIAFVFALVFAWLYRVSGSLWAPVFAHRVINMSAVTLIWLGAA